MFKSLVSTVIFIFVFSVASTQEISKLSNIWYFGDNAGLDFNVEPPIALKNSKLSTQEGVASVASKDGDLLFYTDGITVWDRNHMPMPNDLLNGHPSATQSVIIVPSTENLDQYYIFTVDELAGDNGLQYTIVDMTLKGNGSNSNPNGDFLESDINVKLLSPVTEKLTSIKKENGEGYWIVVHGWGNNKFYAFDLDCNGLNQDPIISEVGAIHGGGDNNINSVGYMKSSQDKSILALINRSISSVEVFNFDVIQGVVSGGIAISIADESLYGLEFATQGEILYIGGTQSIYRYSFDSNNLINIPFDDIALLEADNVVRALQLGPDGEIYVSIRNLSFISMIQNSNLENAFLEINHINIDPDLEGRKMQFGLPNNFNNDIIVYDSVSVAVCPGSSFEFQGQSFEIGSISSVSSLNSENCDSLFVLIVESFALSQTELNISVCENEIFEYDGIQISPGSSEEFVYLDQYGCDSTLTVIVEAHLDQLIDSISIIACEGDEVIFNGVNYNQSGEFEQITENESGCDSTTVISIDFLTKTFGQVSVELCQGESIHINDEEFSSQGVFEQILSNSNGCDSVLHLTIDLLSSDSTLIQTTICQGESIFLFGQEYYEQGDYAVTMKNQFGCDSIINILIAAEDCFNCDIKKESLNIDLSITRDQKGDFTLQYKSDLIQISLIELKEILEFLYNNQNFKKDDFINIHKWVSTSGSLSEILELAVKIENKNKSKNDIFLLQMITDLESLNPGQSYDLNFKFWSY